MITKANLIQFPSGKYGFVGRVPVDLAWAYESIEDVKNAQHAGPGIAARIAKREGRTFSARVWDTDAEARAAALALGAEVA